MQPAGKLGSMRTVTMYTDRVDGESDVFTVDGAHFSLANHSNRPFYCIVGIMNVRVWTPPRDERPVVHVVPIGKTLARRRQSKGQRPSRRPIPEQDVVDARLLDLHASEDATPRPP